MPIVRLRGNTMRQNHGLPIGVGYGECTIFEEYNNVDTGQRDVCYGRIKSIIEHYLYPICPETLRHVLIDCD